MLAAVFIPSPTTMSETTRSSHKVLRALPHTHSQTPPEEHVQQVLHFVCDLKAEAFPNYYVPRASKFLVHGFFDHLCCALGKTEETKSSTNKANLLHNFRIIQDWVNTGRNVF